MGKWIEEKKLKLKHICDKCINDGIRDDPSEWLETALFEAKRNGIKEAIEFLDNYYLPRDYDGITQYHLCEQLKRLLEK